MCFSRHLITSLITKVRTQSKSFICTGMPVLRHPFDAISSNRRYLFTAAISGFILKYVIGIKQLLYSVVLILSGILLTLTLFVFMTFTYNFPKPVKNSTPLPFRFLTLSQWESEIQSFKRDPDQLNQPIAEESFLISETLEELIGYIIKEFIDSWFAKLSLNTLFQDSIRLELKYVFKQLKNRLARVNLAKLLVSKLVPILNDHLVDFIRAEERVQSKVNKGYNDSIEHEIDVARQYRRGKIHLAVTISKTDINDVNEKKYLRSQIGSILPFLLSESERNNDISVSLVQEILACTVLANVFQMIGESDFYNLLIVKLIGDNLKRRDQVKKLREALDQHTQQKEKEKEDTSKQESSSKSNKDYIITENMDIVSYNNCLEKISTTTSLDDLKQLRVYVSFQLLQCSSQKDSSYVHRLKQVQSLVETRIKDLENSRQLELKTILENKTYLTEFSQFLRKRGKLTLLEFWLSVERIKAPLELADDKLSLSLGFSNSNDIKEIYNTFLKGLEFTKNDFRIVEEYINSNDLAEKSRLYQKAREKLFNLQDEAYFKIEYDFKDFTKTEEYKKLVDLVGPSGASVGAGTDANVSPVVIKAVEEAFTQIMKNNNNDFDTQYRSNRQVLTVDLKKDLFGDSSSLFADNSSSSYQNRYSRLFDEFSDDSGNDSDSNLESDTNSNNLQDSTELETDISDNRSNDEDLQSLLLAAPGNLKLTEEIDRLSDEITRLTEQLNILTPLIKKAELTNNVSDYKILKNSRISLEREISSKELQKQQYIVQESDNSLYGKSRVNIQSYISGNENGKEFMLYIIEVQRYSSNDPMTNTAGWIVARRYSQFYKLHEYLRSRYPEVSNLKFPKRTMFKLQQTQVPEIRKAELTEYLQQLLQIPQVCSNRAFRSFLSSENFNLSKNISFEETLTMRGTHKNAELVANKFYQGISNRFNSLPLSRQYGSKSTGNESSSSSSGGPSGGGGSSKSSGSNEEITKNINEMERELKSFDEKEVFVKPIVDILMTIFKLKNSKSWLRGSGLLVILQQIFGTTIERKIYEQVHQLTEEENLLDMLIFLTNIVFPNGKFKDPPVLRTNFEKTNTRDECKFLLSIFMKDTFSTIFGASNTRYAFTMLYNALQNNFLVKHLVFEIFDELVAELFPELEAT